MGETATIQVGARVRRPRHLIDANDLDQPQVEALLTTAAALARTPGGDAVPGLRSRILASLFFEPSTRTRLSFEAAMIRLGGQVISAQDALTSSSAAKGESLRDMVRVVSGYADVIVLRHPATGAAAIAAESAGVPVINAGDGTGQHPTQALLDLYTIRAELGRLTGLRVGLAGDLRHGRTARSLALLLSRFPDNELTLISPPRLRMEADVLGVLRDRGLLVRETSDLRGSAASLDVLYQTRLQRERLDGDEDPATLVRVDTGVMAALPSHAIVMHPLPRVDEIDPAIDDDPRAAYFRQAHNGIAVRMAVLHWVLGGPA